MNFGKRKSRLSTYFAKCWKISMIHPSMNEIESENIKQTYLLCQFNIFPFIIRNLVNSYSIHTYIIWSLRVSFRYVFPIVQHLLTIQRRWENATHFIYWNDTNHVIITRKFPLHKLMKWTSIIVEWFFDGHRIQLLVIIHV